MAAILSSIWRVVRPILKTTTGVLHNVLGDEDQRLRYVSEMAHNPYALRGSPLFNIAGALQAPTGVQALEGVYALDSGNPSDLTEQQRQIINALYTEQVCSILAETIQDLPYSGYDSFQFELTQSYSVPIPTGTSLIETNYCSPIMNLGRAFQEKAAGYYVYKVDCISLQIEAQNQNYSTQIIGYDPLVTDDDIATIQEDLAKLANGGNPRTSATGHSVRYYYADNTQIPVGFDAKLKQPQLQSTPSAQNSANPNPPTSGRISRTRAKAQLQAQKQPVYEEQDEYEDEDPSVQATSDIGPDGKPLRSISEYLRETARIKKLVSSATFQIGSNAFIHLNAPSARYVSMRSDQLSEERISSPGTYSMLEAANDFFVQETPQNRASLYHHQMPVYGKIQFAISNAFDKDINLITSTTYVITCKREKQQAGYV